ncbi:unnamed protein product [Cochlearia groenlandica]
MEDLLDRMGTKILMTMEDPTYLELTRQFLATVGYEEQESGGKGPYTTTTVELGFIYEPLRYWLHDASGAPVNHGCSHVCQTFEFLKHLMSIREEEEEIRHDYGITIGGMLTPLFRSLRIDLQDFENFQPHTWMKDIWLRQRHAREGSTKTSICIHLWTREWCPNVASSQTQGTLTHPPMMGYDYVYLNTFVLKFLIQGIKTQNVGKPSYLSTTIVYTIYVD